MAPDRTKISWTRFQCVCVCHSPLVQMVLGFYSGKIISATFEIVKIVKIDSKNIQQILQICVICQNSSGL